MQKKHAVSRDGDNGSMTATIEQHPLSAAFPAMQSDEYQDLVDSIIDIGVQNPITLFEGMVIDGWHRYKAAKESGIACPTVELGDVDPREFVVAQNKARRNLTASQRADAVISVYRWRPHGDQRSAPGADRDQKNSAPGADRDQKNCAPGADLIKTAKELAVIAGVGTRTIEQLKAVHVSAVQAVQDAVKNGAITGKTAAAIAKLPADEQNNIAAQGPKAMRAAAKPAPLSPPEIDDDGAPDEAELAALEAEEKADADAMRLLLESDAPLADVTEKYKQALLTIALLNARIVGFQNENTVLIRTVKGLQKKLSLIENNA